MVKIALKFKPSYICLVAEKKTEITTEGGLNLKKKKNKIQKIINVFNSKNMKNSLFINPSV